MFGFNNEKNKWRHLQLRVNDEVYSINETSKNYICCMKILFVCLGNICRSPLAQGILEAKARAAGLNWEIDSAGTNGYHIGEAPHKLSQKVAALNGVDISMQRARRFVQDDFNTYDKIYVMADEVYKDAQKVGGIDFDESKIDFFLNELEPGSNMDVPDPWYGDEDGYHECYDLINRTCDIIIKKYKD